MTQEQAENNRVLELCLKQIDECRPFFIGILGQRYGWVPTRLPDDAAREHGWLKNHADRSLTELKILHGVLENRCMAGEA